MPDKWQQRICAVFVLSASVALLSLAAWLLTHLGE
jgi:hypothetical protein